MKILKNHNVHTKKKIKKTCTCLNSLKYTAKKWYIEDARFLLYIIDRL